MLYKLYEFQYFLLRKQYKKSEIKDLFSHLSVTFPSLIISPLFSIYLSFDSLRNLFPWFNSLDSLEKKIAIFPIIAFMTLIIYRLLVKNKKFHKRVYKLDLCGKSFSDYPLGYKIGMFVIMILMYLSALYVPIIVLEIQGG